MTETCEIQKVADLVCEHRKQPAQTPQIQAPVSKWDEWSGSASWWLVSCSLHLLIIVLAGLITMAIQPPRSDDAVIMITELKPTTTIAQELEKPRAPETALESKMDMAPTDPTSKEMSDIVVASDIRALAALGDHFETINPERPDTYSAYGNEDAKMFHSAEGNSDNPGGGGTGGMELADTIGVGGAGSRGTGGGFGGGNGTGVGVGTGLGKGSFGQRSGGGRQLMIKRHGGSKASESAVDKALTWLAYHQEADGHWNTKKYQAAVECDTFATGVAVLAFLGAGHTERVGQWKENVQRAVAWLIASQENGRVLSKADQGRGYSIAVGTMALAEAAGMANISETRAAAQKAVDYCIEVHQQGEGSEKGAWRYIAKSSSADLSVSGWFIMALKSAKVSGLHVDPAAFEGASRFLDKVQKKVEDKDLKGVESAYGPVLTYGYQEPGAGVRTCAIGNLARQFMGWKKEDVQGSVEWFVNHWGVPGDNPRFPGHETVDLYYWYYGTLCTFQQGGEVWKKWNEGMKTTLLQKQSKDGDNSGSWNPEGNYSEKWGRVSQTALSALCLEVYYRYAMLTPDK